MKYNILNSITAEEMEREIIASETAAMIKRLHNKKFYEETETSTGSDLKSKTKGGRVMSRKILKKPTSSP